MNRRLIAAIFLIPAIASGYMTWLSWRAGDDGKWLFGVFTLFSLLLGISPLLPELKPKKPPEAASTRFAPHWVMMLAILLMIGVAVAAIIGAILRR